MHKFTLCPCSCIWNIHIHMHVHVQCELLQPTVSAHVQSECDCSHSLSVPPSLSLSTSLSFTPVSLSLTFVPPYLTCHSLSLLPSLTSVSPYIPPSLSYPVYSGDVQWIIQASVFWSNNPRGCKSCLEIHHVPRVLHHNYFQA